MTVIDELCTSYSRRTVIEATLGLASIVALCGLPAVRAAAADALSGTGLRYLSPAEATAVDAIVAQIIPTDETPGAREMGVMHFIDRALAGFLSPQATTFRAGLSDFETRCCEAHPERVGFASLTGAQQMQWLREVERTPFFEYLQQLTVLGALTMPAYGGNQNGLGWQLIGFEDLHAFQPPFGHYDRDYPGFESQESAS